MKIYVMTDMEGVAGVLDDADYTAPTSRYYERACELTTLETNAAIEGAIEAGATEFLVADGHGWGAINPTLLHPAARLYAGRGLRYPFGCDESFDAAFIIGQHAMSNADGGHLAHTGGFNVENQTLNGQEVGELAVNMLMCAYFGVPTVFLAGDQACCEEVRRLIPSIETVAVKAGDKRGSASGLSLEENRLFNSAAIHLAPTHARELIRDGARRALLRRHEIPKFWVEPPYEWTMTLRPEADSPALRAVANHSDFMALLEAPKNFEKVA